MADPFTVLGVDEDADDAEVRRAYLALVREFPPDRAPERFQAYRAAYEQLSDERKRLDVKLLHNNARALSRMMTAKRRDAAPLSARASQRTVAALLSEGILSVARRATEPET